MVAYAALSFSRLFIFLNCYYKGVEYEFKMHICAS